MRLELTKECALIAVAAYLIGLTIDNFFTGVIALLFFLLILGVVKDYLEELLNRDTGDESPAGSEDSEPKITNLLRDKEQKIVDALKEGEMTQTELMARTGMAKSTLSRTLKDLEEREVVIRYDSGMSKIVKLTNQ